MSDKKWEAIKAEEAQRAEFEKKIVAAMEWDENWATFELSKYPNGNYISSWAQGAWEGYQLGREESSNG